MEFFGRVRRSSNFLIIAGLKTVALFCAFCRMFIICMSPQGSAVVTTACMSVPRDLQCRFLAISMFW